MPHMRSPSKAAEGRTVLAEGVICRESNVADRLVNKRWMQLLAGGPGGSLAGGAPEPPVLASYRHSGDAEPSKVWPITSTCSLSDVEKGTFHLRVDTSTLVALVAAKYTAVEMYSFTVHFGFSGLFAAESLRLCFADEPLAQQWHDQLSGLISRLEALGSGGSTNSGLLHAPSDLASSQGAAGAGAASAAAAEATAAAQQQAQAQAQAEEERAMRAWQSVRHVNGVAVYAEEEGLDGEGGALMVSAIVRSSPQECFEVLMASGGSKSAGMLHGDERVLEVVDRHTQVVLHSFQPGGLVGKLCAPREMVLLRSWRQDADGTYIVLYQSTNHRKARQTKGGLLNWKSPVRAQVQAAGFTVAPLLPRYTGGGPSQECLVTLVMKVDLGGWLSQGSLVRRLGAPLSEALLRAWLEPMLLSVVMLRDKVEQSRFVVRPYSMGDALEDATETPRSEATEATAASARKVARTTTFLTYTGRRSQDLRDSQHGVGPEARGGATSAADSEWEDGGAEFLDALPGGPSRRASHDGGAVTAARAAAAAGPAVGAEELAAVRQALAKQHAREVPEDERWAVQVGTRAAALVDGYVLLVPHATCWLRAGWLHAVQAFAAHQAALLDGRLEQQKRCRQATSAQLATVGAELTDRKKIPAAMPMFDLYSAELVEVDEPMWHMARFLPSVKYCAAPFMFILQLMVPANPPISLTMVWTAPLNPMTESLDTLCAAWPEDENGTVRSFFTNLCNWMQGDGPEADAVRNKKFKLIPRIVKGSWIVKQSVGTTPVLLGQKLATRYFRGPNYFEVDVDITSNTVANSVTSLVVGAITSLVVDLAPLVEGQADEELPERLIGSVRFEHLDLKTAAYLDDESGRIFKNERFGG